MQVRKEGRNERTKKGMKESFDEFFGIYLKFFDDRTVYYLFI